jgi:hypothetical protein
VAEPPPQAIRVLVTSQQTGAPIVDGLTGTLRDGSYVELMSVWDGNELGGAWGRAGTYDVRVEAAGFEPWEQENVRSREGSCGLTTVRIAAEMTPT